MDGSDDFDADWPELDASTLQEVERLEKAAKTNPTLARTGSLSAVTRPLVIVNNGATTAGVGFSRDNRLNFQQKDLFGNTVAQQQASTSRGMGASSTSANPNPVNAVVRKQWDRTAYAKSGVIRSKGKGKAKGKPAKGRGKGKNRQHDDDDQDDDDEEEEDEEPDPDDPLFDPEEARRPPKPMKLEADREACKTFVYPLNKPLRKYQYDIIAKAFFTDTLVALPTGLGKTFLAAVLMYNYYRWFPKGKIIFMAPSRPLVTQQISACHGIVGIPLKDAVEMTGKDLPEKRAEAWRKRRVFYCTPQTVQNDLFKQRLDPSEVVCMVIDEAHKATGDYAYCKVIRYMMQKNPHFRVLALTATPGGNAEVVQSVLDALHIGHIEVRSDESFDTRQYIHNKRVDLVKIPIEGELESIRERYGNLMKILLDQVRDIVKTSKTDPTTMHPYLFQASMKLVGQSGKKWAYTTLTFLGAMARGIAKLLEQSVTAFFEDLKALRKSAKGKAAEVINHRDFATIYKDTEDLVSGKGFAGHPKMVKLSELVLEHFEASRKEGTLESTRIMVFCTFREVVEEIVQRLNGFDGIRATRLVGQGTDTKGKKGLDQKQQNKTLSSFKKGDFNVLVATSIGEEGLDIGELDLIICYDAAKSPIRTLQRAGRTGRARQGRVIVLMTEGMEDDNWKKANEKYKEVQNAILSGKQFELYADCQRLVPADIRPVADKKELVIEPFEPEQLGLGRKIAPTGKRKRDENDNLDLFETGFQRASGRKTSVQQPRNLSAAPKSKSGPESYIPEGDPYLAPEEANDLKRRTVKPTLPVQDFRSLQHTTFPKKVPLELSSSKRFVGTSSRTNTLWTALRTGQELSADRNKHAAWERATYDVFKPSNVNWWESATSGKDRGFEMLRNSNSASKTGISHLSSDDTDGQHSIVNSAHANVHNTVSEQHYAPDEMSDDDLPVINGLSSSKSAEQSESIVMLAGDKNKVPSKGSSIAATCGARPLDRSVITIDDSDDEQQGQAIAETIPRTVPARKNDKPEASETATKITSVDDSDLYFDDLDMSDIVAIEKPAADPRRVFGGADERSRPISPALASITNKLSGQPSLRSGAKHSDDESPILAPKKRVKRVAIVTSSPDKASAQAIAAAAQHLPTTEETMDQCEPSDLNGQQVRKRLRAAGHAGSSKGHRRPRTVNSGLAAYLDTVAVNSDNEDSASCTSEEIAAETTSDRVFLDSEDVANPNDMSKFYRESLMSQAAHKFGNEAVRPGAYKMKRILHQKGRPIVEDPEDESQEGRVTEQSQYERGSFCVDDDEELEYSQRDDNYLDDSE